MLSVVAGDKIHEPPSVLVKDGMLLATVQVASVNAEGRLRLPTHVKAIWLDVGTSSQLTICSQGDCQNQSIFILGFEPLQDKWAKMLARSSTRLGTRSKKTGLAKNRVPLGKSATNAMVLPFAISSEVGHATFHVTGLDGCASLRTPKKVNDTRYSKHVRTICTEEVETRQVPTLSLEYVLGSLLPRGLPVEKLKVDAQGHDLSIVQSGSALVQGIQEIMLESYPDDCPPFYEGQPLCSVIVAGMAELGFSLWKTPACSKGGGCGTQNLIFHRATKAVESRRP